MVAGAGRVSAGDVRFCGPIGFTHSQEWEVAWGVFDFRCCLLIISLALPLNTCTSMIMVGRISL